MREDLLTITWVKYTEPHWGILKYGPKRWGICLGPYTLLVEAWWLR